METGNLVTLTIPRPDGVLFKNAENMLVVAQDYQITTPDMALAAGEDLRAVKTLAKQLEEKRIAITGPINKGLQEVNALFKPAKEWLERAETLLKGKLLHYQAEERRKADEAQARADEEARRQREKLEAQATKAEASGKIEKAETLREQAQTQVAPIVMSAAPKIGGLAAREIWKAEITDKAALVRHIFEARPDLLPIIEINQSALNAQARSLKEALNLPGVKVIKEAGIAARAA